MRRHRRIVAGTVAAVVAAAALSACGGSSESGSLSAGQSAAAESSVGLIGPVTLTVDELRNATVELSVGRVLTINTGGVPVESYRGDVADRRVAKFEKGRDDGSVRFNPGVTAVAPGTTAVTMTNEDAGIEPVRFTVTVTGAK